MVEPFICGLREYIVSRSETFSSNFVEKDYIYTFWLRNFGFKIFEKSLLKRLMLSVRFCLAKTVAEEVQYSFGFWSLRLYFSGDPRLFVLAYSIYTIYSITIEVVHGVDCCSGWFKSLRYESPNLDELLILALLYQNVWQASMKVGVDKRFRSWEAGTSSPINKSSQFDPNSESWKSSF